MKSHARKQLLYWPLCCGGARNRASIAARLSGSRRRRLRRRRPENSIIGGCGFCMRAGRGSRNHGESQRRGPQRHKRKSSCLPRGFILACWGRGGDVWGYRKIGFRAIFDFLVRRGVSLLPQSPPLSSDSFSFRGFRNRRSKSPTTFWFIYVVSSRLKRPVRTCFLILQCVIW